MLVFSYAAVQSLRNSCAAPLYLYRVRFARSNDVQHQLGAKQHGLPFTVKREDPVPLIQKPCGRAVWCNLLDYPDTLLGFLLPNGGPPEVFAERAILNHNEGTPRIDTEEQCTDQYGTPEKGAARSNL